MIVDEEVAVTSQQPQQLVAKQITEKNVSFCSF